MFKRITIALFTIVFIFSVTVPVCAESIDFKEGTQEVSPNWWPGNPNPQPGTEDWFFQHPDYGSNAEPHQADKCAQKAFDDAYIYNMTESIAVWVVTGSFSLAAFATAFGTSYAISYATCLYNEGVR